MKVPFEIRIDRIQVATDPPVEIFEMEVAGHDGGVWMVSFDTEIELKACIQGLVIASSFFGIIMREPEIPTKPTRFFVEKKKE